MRARCWHSRSAAAVGAEDGGCVSGAADIFDAVAAADDLSSIDAVADAPRCARGVGTPDRQRQLELKTAAAFPVPPTSSMPLPPLTICRPSMQWRMRPDAREWLALRSRSSPIERFPPLQFSRQRTPA